MNSLKHIQPNNLSFGQQICNKISQNNEPFLKSNNVSEESEPVL